MNKNEEKLFKQKQEIALTIDFTDDYFNPTKGIRFAPTVGMGLNLTASLDNPSMIGFPIPIPKAPSTCTTPYSGRSTEQSAEAWVSFSTLL